MSEARDHPLVRRETPKAGDRRTGLIAVASAARSLSVAFGGRDVSSSMTRGRVSNKINGAPLAALSIDPSKAPLFDYLAPLVVATRAGDDISPAFTGDVIAANPSVADANVYEISATGMAQFSEKTTGRLGSWGVPPIDLIYMLARTAGMSESQIVLDSVDRLPHEVIEIARSVASLSASSPLRMGGVTILPRATVDLPMPGEPDERVADLHAEFRGGTAIAVTYVSGYRRMYDAETVGLRRIDDAMNWVRVNSRYGGSRWPNGEPRAFSRENARATVRAEGPVWVRAMGSGRTWLRDTEVPSRRAVADLLEILAPGLAPPDVLADRLAVAACARAADDGLTTIDRVGALWEALEYYAGGISVEPLLSKGEKRAIKRSLPSGLTSRQRSRIEALVDEANRPPLLARVRAGIEAHGVPVTDAEMDLLRRLRGVRNDTVHGRVPEPITRSDIDYGVSVVARLLLHRAGVAGVEDAGR